MSFTPTQKLSIVEILPGATPTLLNAHLTSLGAALTADIEAEVIVQITSWTSGVGSKFVRLTATESNMGVNTNSEDRKNYIIANIAKLLEWPYWAPPSHIGTIQVSL